MMPKIPSEAYGLLFDAAVQFRYYEQTHLAKDTYESKLKAKVNADFATKIEDYLRKVDDGAA